MRWTVEIFNSAVTAEVEALPNDMRARLSRYVMLIQEFGFEALPREAVKHPGRQALGIADHRP